MKKSIVIIVLLFIAQTSVSQRGQVIAYIDMDYILENVPEYVTAEKSLNNKIIVWKANLIKLERHIEILKTDLVNEKAILTKDIVEEREENITIKREELSRLESLYFGPQGDMYILRKQLVKPIQDQIYDAIQDIVKKKKYDFVLDKSSDLVMLYSNKKYDISELVLNDIVRERKLEENKEKRAKKRTPNKELTDRQKKAVLDREAAIKKKEEDRLAKKKKIEEARKKRIADIAQKRKILKEKKEAIRKKREQDNKDQDNN